MAQIIEQILGCLTSGSFSSMEKCADQLILSLYKSLSSDMKKAIQSEFIETAKAIDMVGFSAAMFFLYAGLCFLVGFLIMFLIYLKCIRNNPEKYGVIRGNQSNRPTQMVINLNSNPQKYNNI